MDEFDLIDRYFARHGRDAEGVALGVGDDGAVVDVNAHEQLVIATDTVVEGTHFPATMPPHALGHRCLAVNLSDLAAMGAEPRWCTLALSMPAAEERWLDAFSAGFFDLSERAGIALIGGDTVRGPLSVTVTVHGRVPRGGFIARSGAHDGDQVFVTGTPGDAAAGLHLLAAGKADTDTEALQRRFLYPEPRSNEGVALRGVASAMIDISDGLDVDLRRLTRASGVGAEMDVGRLPLSEPLTALLTADAAAQSALTGGDDYELCFTAPDAAQVDALARDWPCPVTRIGRIVAGSGVVWRRDDVPWEFDARGFAHFAG